MRILFTGECPRPDCESKETELVSKHLEIEGLHLYKCPECGLHFDVEEIDGERWVEVPLYS